MLPGSFWPGVILLALGTKRSCPKPDSDTKPKTFLVMERHGKLWSLQSSAIPFELQPRIPLSSVFAEVIHSTLGSPSTLEPRIPGLLRSTSWPACGGTVYPSDHHSSRGM